MVGSNEPGGAGEHCRRGDQAVALEGRQPAPLRSRARAGRDERHLPLKPL